MQIKRCLYAGRKSRAWAAISQKDSSAGNVVALKGYLRAELSENDAVKVRQTLFGRVIALRRCCRPDLIGLRTCLNACVQSRKAVCATGGISGFVGVLMGRLGLLSGAGWGSINVPVLLSLVAATVPTAMRAETYTVLGEI